LNLSPDTPQPLSAETRRRVELARLEADVAYFCARLELVGQPVSSNQAAQRKAFWHLYEQLAGLHFGNGDGDGKPAPTPSDE